jgi:hypothetical protein
MFGVAVRLINSTPVLTPCAAAATPVKVLAAPLTKVVNVAALVRAFNV